MISSKIKTLIGLGVVVIILLIVSYKIMIPSYPVTPINKILENSDNYKGQKVRVEGYPVLLSSLNTKYGLHSFWALKDGTGQIPVETNGSWKGVEGEISIVGTVAEICVSEIYDEEKDNITCDKKRTGLKS